MKLSVVAILGVCFLSACASPLPVVETIGKYSISGYAVDKDTGEPISGVRVSLRYSKGGFWSTPTYYYRGETTTNGEGYFNIKSSPETVWNLSSKESVSPTVVFEWKNNRRAYYILRNMDSDAEFTIRLNNDNR